MKKNLKKKISINKITVANLNEIEMKLVKGGGSCSCRCEVIFDELI